MLIYPYNGWKIGIFDIDFLKYLLWVNRTQNSVYYNFQSSCFQPLLSEKSYANKVST